jgi:hypothetical protein
VDVGRVDIEYESGGGLAGERKDDVGHVLRHNRISHPSRLRIKDPVRGRDCELFRAPHGLAFADNEQRRLGTICSNGDDQGEARFVLNSCRGTHPALDLDVGGLVGQKRPECLVHGENA